MQLRRRDPPAGCGQHQAAAHVEVRAAGGSTLQRVGHHVAELTKECLHLVDRGVILAVRRLCDRVAILVLSAFATVVKEFARANPPRMKPWPADSRTNVATMGAGDFRSNEKSLTIDAPTTVCIEHVAASGAVTVLKDGLALKQGEVPDATSMSVAQLTAFYYDVIAAHARLACCSRCT